MKSIMEEASSIMKAIEKGWINAGQPKEFTVKIFEEVQKNFIGMTVRPAKIGIFFAESQPETPTQPKKVVTPQQAPKRQETTRVQQQKVPKIQRKQPAQIQKELAEKPVEKTVEPEVRQLGPVWNDEMIASVQQWLHELFALIGIDFLSFTIEPEHFLLKIRFDKAIYDDKTREKYLFSSLSTLIITMLKRHYKRPLKGYKIVLLGA